MQEAHAKNFLPVVGLIGPGWPFGRLGCFRETPPKHAAESRDSPADFEPPKGSGLGLGSGWSGPVCEIETDHKRPGESFLHTCPAFRGSRKRWGSLYKSMVFVYVEDKGVV